MSFRVWQLVRRLVAVVCMLDETQVVISELGAARTSAVVDGDMTA